MRLIDVNREKGSLRISGFIGKPEISRGNRSYENYFINGRYVKSKIIAKGVEDGYKTFMMQHRYPFVCLNITIDDKTMLDVNVHPAKLELRFSNQNLIYDMVQETVRDALSGKELIPEVTLQEPEKPQETKEKPPLEKLWKAPEQTKTAAAPQDKNLEYFMAQMRRRV